MHGCMCGGTFVEFEQSNGLWVVKWRVCDKCGGALTNSGKYIPPHSGWDIPAIPEGAGK